MPLAKRRKASLGQEVEKSSENESRSSTPVQDGSPISFSTGSMVVESDHTDNGDEEVTVKDASFPSNKISVSTSEKESSKRGRSKSLGEAILEIKVNEEAMKPVRISERLSIKRNRIGDEEEGDVVAPTPKKPKTTSTENKYSFMLAVSKQPKKTPSSTTATLAGTSKAIESTGELKSENVVKKKKQKKSFSPWSMEEMKLFFTYLGVYGKNFDAISEQISFIAKKRGIVPRNKCQVRFLYYRTVAKVSKILQIGGVMTSAQELFILINYGAVWNHVKDTNPQFSKCLKELIQNGRTTYSSVIGRNKRCGKVQTPMCAYLKEKVEEKQVLEDEVKLPTHLTIELTPKNSSAWSRVQEMSQNPRVRFQLSTHRTLESVFKYLNSKWKSNSLRLKEAMGEKPEVSEDELIFHFHPSSEVTPFTLKPVAVESQKKVGHLKSYVEQIFPTNLFSDLKETDQTEVASSKEREPEEGKEIVQNANRKDEEGQSLGLDSPVKNEPVTVLESDKQRAALAENENDILNEKELKEPTVGISSGCMISVSGPNDILKNEEHSGQVFTDEKKDNCMLLKSEPCDEEETQGECTRDQYLDFTPNGNLTVVSKSLSQTQSMSLTESSSSITTSSSSLSSSLSSSSVPSNTKLQLSPSISKNESSSLPTSSSTSTLSPPTLPSSSPSSSKIISSPLRSLAHALNLKPVLNLSPSPSSSLSDSTSAKSLLSPHSNSKKGAKKKINFCDNNTIDSSSSSQNIFNESDPNANVQNQTTDSQSSKTNNNDAAMEQVPNEFERLHNLAKSGFLLSNSNTVTLIHLYLLFGRAPVIRLEYEWVSKQGSQAQNQHPLPAFCSPSNPVANCLRRLCHIAALELASFKFNHRQHSVSKEKEKNKPETTESVNHRIKKKVSVRNYGTMTDARITMPRHAIPILPAGKIIHHHSHSHPHHHHHHHSHKIDSTIQMNGVGGGELFRVPVVPAYRPVMSKEEEEKLKLQQKQAEAIMQDCSMQRSRLLKRRNVRSRSKPIIVQRTLLPKVPNERIITYIQPPTSHSQVMVSKGPLEITMPSISQSLISTTLNLVACNAMVTTTNTITTSLGGSNGGGQPSESQVSQPSVSVGSLPSVSVGVLPSVSLGTLPSISPGSQSSDPLGGQPSVSLGASILELAIESANIRPSPVKDDAMSSLSCGDVNHMTLQTTPPSTPLHPSLTMTSRENASLSIADQSNISISDFDISLTSASTSNMGPDAGDKFLDSVLERSQQGFSGLITPVVKLSERSTTPHQHPVLGLDSSLSAFDLSGMKTPPRSSSPSPIINSPPSKVTNPDQSWMSGESADVSLSSILGVFSSFQGRQQEPKLKTPCKMSVSLFDQSSSDGVDNSVTVTIPKPNFASDVSFNALLGDPPLSSPVIKTDDSQHANHQTDSSGGHTSLVDHPPSLFSDVSQDSLAKLDMDVTLQGMVNDSSMDLVSKFEKLAAQMAENRHEQEVAKPSLMVKHSGIDLVKDNSPD